MLEQLSALHIRQFYVQERDVKPVTFNLANGFARGFCCLDGVVCTLEDGFSALEEGPVVVNNKDGVLLDGSPPSCDIAKNPTDAQ